MSKTDWWYLLHCKGTTVYTAPNGRARVVEVDGKYGVIWDRESQHKDDFTSPFTNLSDARFVADHFDQEDTDVLGSFMIDVSFEAATNLPRRPEICNNCPFRADRRGGKLSRGFAGNIVVAFVRQQVRRLKGEWVCHETIVGDGMKTTNRSMRCHGAPANNKNARIQE